MHRIAHRLATFMALAGGTVLTCLILLTCLSVLGRGLNTALHGTLGGLFPEVAAFLLALGVGPINGDFELVEAGMAFTIFAFLPYCQLKNGHAVVDVFADVLPAPVRRIWRAVIEVVFAAVIVLLTYQLFEGLLSKRQYGETTFLLQFPIWWSYGLSLGAAVVASLVALYKAALSVGVPTGESEGWRD